jgi:hypothetical protein
MIPSRVLALVVSLGVLLAAGGAARADDAAQAKTLYDEGKNLFAEGHYTEALGKLEASFKLNQLSGTRGLLAACYEKLGRLASAWNAYVDSAAIADRSGNAQRAEVARAKAAELEPRLARVTIDASAAAGIPGIEIVVDGVVQPDGALGRPFPVDAGQHLIEARAVDHRPWKTTIDIEDGEQQQVVVEKLAEDPTQRLAAEKRLRDHRARVRRRKILAFSIGGGGVVAVGVATTLGLVARSAWNDAKAAGCTSDGTCPTPELARKAASAGRKADLATIIGGVGLAAVATGVILYVTRPSDELETTTVTPTVTSETVGIAVGGRF